MLNYLSLITPEHLSVEGSICKIALPLEVQVELSSVLLSELERGVLVFDDLDTVEYRDGVFSIYGYDVTTSFNKVSLLSMIKELLVDVEPEPLEQVDEKIYKITKSGTKMFANQEIEDDYLYLYKTELAKGNLENAKAIRSMILECNMGLVNSLIKKYVIGGFAAISDDLFQEGCMGVLKALDKFDINQDIRFSTYAVPYISAALKRYIYDNSKTIRTPEYIGQRLQKYKRYIEEARKLGLEPTDEDIRTYLNIPQVDYIELKYAAEQEALIDLNAPVEGQDGGTSSLAEVIQDKSSSDFYRLSGLYKDEFMSVLLEATQKGLEPKKLQALCLYMGLCDDGETHTQEEIAEEFGVTKQAVGVWIKQALEYLRNPVYSERLREIMQEESYGGKHK